MKFDIQPIINDLPGDFAYFKKKHKKKLLASLIHERSHWTYTRTRLAEAQNWKCCYCGCYMIENHGHKNSVTVEHVIAKSKGGSNDPSNLAASCARCNEARGNKTIEEFMSGACVQQSSAETRLLARIRKYVKKAYKLAEVNFIVNEYIQCFDDWFATLKLPKKGVEMFYAEFQLTTV